ncbi:MAG TPA: sulfatase-like hydrolase/transferase, partial [Ruminococcus flavefaciens]|nr:sulfatase-like hydrolase/transferase [Ruminococcus flavefaciens]
MINNIVLISKDILMPQYLPIYGNSYWKTPNIDELAAKGTVFKRHYTAAPSTAMAFTAMFTGNYPHETGYATYREVQEYNGETLFDRLYERGYQCHLVGAV